MIIVLKPECSKEQLEHFTQSITRNHNVKVNTWVGTQSTVLGLIGDTSTIDIDYENKVVVATHLKSTGAGGGYGDAMLDFENTPYAPYLSDEAAMKLLNFYATYVNIITPVPFSTYEKYNTQTALIDTVNSDLHVGATYTANGFMYMMNRVIEYAQYYHQSLSAGKVVR